MATSASRATQVGTEMLQKGQRVSLFDFKLRPIRPISQSTEFSDEEWESDSGTDFDDDDEYDASRPSFDSAGRGSQSTISVLDEAPTPISPAKHVLQVGIRRLASTRGPQGPHLFRSSVDTVNLEETAAALQLSPLQAKDWTTIVTETPIRITETPVSVAATARPCESDETAARGIRDDDVSKWTVEDVVAWAYRVGLEDSAIRAFRSQDVNGTVLLGMEIEHLKELGINSLGKRHQIWAEIVALRANVGLQNASTPIEDENPQHGPFSAIEPSRRVRRVKGFEDLISPQESVSIVAIEQLLPKPHKCSKGENCARWKKQQKMREQVEKDFAISPGPGGEIYIAGDPSALARPVSEADPSVVASSDLLGPGQHPEAAVPEVPKLALRTDNKAELRDHVKQFLTFQHVQAPTDLPPSPPLETPFLNIAMTPRVPPPASPHSNLQQLPKLQIPRSSTSNSNRKVSPNERILRVGTPMSAADVPITVNLTPIARDISASVPPNMRFRQPVVRRPGSRGPAPWQRNSLLLTPVMENGQVVDLISPARKAVKARYGEATSHAGFVKKRRTRFLRHDWNEQHVRLAGTTLAMHETDRPEDRKVLETIDVDDYAVACSSLGTNSKFSAALKSLKLSSGKKDQQLDASFVFQLIPAADRARVKALLRDGKTHYFAVKTSDERIDWMREVMLAKAVKQKSQGFEIDVNGQKV